MRLVFLHANSAWVVLLGDTMVRLDGERMLFPSRQDAVDALYRKHLGVLAEKFKYGYPVVALPEERQERR